MMSNRFRILVLITLAVLAVSAIGSAFPLPSISLLFDSTRAGFAKPEVTRRPPANVAPPVRTDTDTKLKPSAQFTIYQDINGEFVCRTATTSERREMANPDLESLGMRPINHLDTVDKTRGIQPSAAPNLTIVLRATQQLQQNAAATAAFTRAAKNWEDIIKSPVTVYMDVDYGATRFGQPWSSGVLGQTGVESQSYPYQSVRTNLIAEANGEGNATKQSLFNALPGTTVPTDVGDANSTDVADPGARAIGLLPATAQSTDDAARIAFNSNFTFDFDPSDGITVGQTDFDAVATHEIGHALGFDSEAGSSLARPSVWDLYRFRTGVTNGTFTAAQRILTIGGSPDTLQFYFAPGNTELGLSTGGPTGASTNGGDGWQSSHWKHVNGCSPSYIGIMDPAIPSGCRRTITSNDILALSSFGYNLTNNNAPPPPPPPPPAPANDNFASGQTISSCSGSITGTNFSATSESGEPSHDPPDATSLSPSRSVWYQWQAPSSGSVTMTTAGSDFDTIIAVYTGSTLNVLSRIVFNDDVQDGVIRTSSVTFSATGGTVYKIAIDGWGGEQGGIKLNWTGCGAPSPTPTPTPSPTSTPTPTPTPVPCPGSLTVNDNGDAADVSVGNRVCATAGGVCTLRAAIQETNALTSCGTININFSGVASPINLGSVLPTINHNTSVNGPGADQLTVQRSPASGTADFRVFTTGGIGVSVTLAGLTISNGRLSTDIAGAGGGILNTGGTLTISGSIVSGNSALDGGGIFNSGGSLNILNSTITGNSTSPGGGAGIASNGASLTVINIVSSTIANNIAAGDGGGLRIGNSGNGALPAYIINSTISNNSTKGRGGGLMVSGDYTMNVVNGTITTNRANSAGTTGLTGGGVSRPSGFLKLRNTIVAGNFAGTGAAADDIRDTIDVTSSFNLLGTGGSGTLTNGVNNNQVGVSNTGLGILAANGGPVMTHALLAGSPALNAGSNALAVDQNGNALSTDQRGAGFGRIINGTVDIGAFEAPAGGINPIDQQDLFVRQHYLDFLNREPDQSGWNFWTNQITSCGANPPCIEVRRIDVSASFFLSIEFQNNGYLVERFYKVAYGNANGNSTFGGAHQLSVPVVRFSEFIQGTQRIGQNVIVLAPGWEQLLESNKQAYALEFVQTSRFISAFPTNMTPTEFVDKLNANAGNVLSATERNTAINLFSGAANSSNTNSRAQAVRQVAEDTDLYNAEYNRAFVLAEYFGYLSRNPNDAPESTLDYTGYDFWLTKLNQFNGNYINAEMVKAFLSSIEYRQRFGP